MNDALWFYVSTDRQRQGPVNADELLALLNAGSISRRTLVWRQGMPQWQPMDQLADELGLSAPVAAPMPPPAPEPAATRVLSYDDMPPSALESRPATRQTDGLEAAYAASAHDASATGGIDHDDVVDAGFLRRLAALMIDGVLLTIATYAIVFLMLIVIGVGVGGITELFGASAGGEPPSGPLLIVFVLGFYVFPFLLRGSYYVLFTRSAWQATPGKRAVGIKVVDLDGQRISTGRATGRWFAAALSYMTLYIGFLMAAFTDRKQALHDMVAGTRVVDQWAYTDHPERQQRGLGGCAIAALIGIGLLFVAFVVGIVAAVSLPAYQEYSQRAQLAGVVAEAEALKLPVAEFRANTDRCPSSIEEIGVAEPSNPLIAKTSLGEMNEGQCTIQFELGGTANASFSGEYLWFSLEESGAWRCSGSMADKLLPPLCQG